MFSTILVAVQNKDNGDLPKIIFGFKLLKDLRFNQVVDPFLMVSCQVQTYFSIDFLFTIMVFFFSAATLFLLISLAYVLRKRYLEKRKAEEDKRKKMECMTKIMPSQKYEAFVE